MMARAFLFSILCALCWSAFGQSVQDVVNARDRIENDKKMDDVRKPVELLNFLELKKDMRIADLGAGGGYSSELMARFIGKKGVVFAQNPENWTQFTKKALTERQKSFPEIVQVYRPFEEPMAPKVTDLDLATMIFIYHDTVHLGTDRAKMNKAVFNMLKPGAYYVILDHRAKKGAGATETKTMHRIEESVIREEVLAAGFEFVESADFLAYPEDPKDFKAFGRPQPRTDRFVLKFRKPL